MILVYLKMHSIETLWGELRNIPEGIDSMRPVAENYDKKITPAALRAPGPDQGSAIQQETVGHTGRTAETLRLQKRIRQKLAHNSWEIRLIQTFLS